MERKKPQLPPLCIFAAGHSKRMGFPKGLLKANGRHLIDLQLASFAHAGGKEAILVLGDQIERYTTLLKKIHPQTLNVDQSTYGHLKITVVPHFHKNKPPFPSIQKGLHSFLSQRSGLSLPWVFIHPVDIMPIKPSSFSAIYSEALAAADSSVLALFPQFAEKRGHPILIHRRLAQQIVESPESSRMDVLLKKVSMSQKRIVNVNDENILTNVNTPQEWLAQGYKLLD